MRAEAALPSRAERVWGAVAKTATSFDGVYLQRSWTREIVVPGREHAFFQKHARACVSSGRLKRRRLQQKVVQYTAEAR